MIMNFDKYEKALMDEKNSIQSRIVDGKENLKTHNELSYYDNHPADTGSELFQTEKDLVLNSRDESTLKKINSALDNIHKGTYGICENCGAKIPLERLEAIPYTTLCPKCQNEQYEYTTLSTDFNAPIRYDKFSEYNNKRNNPDDTMNGPKLT